MDKLLVRTSRPNVQLLGVTAFLPLNQLLSEKDEACFKKNHHSSRSRQHKTKFYKANHPKCVCLFERHNSPRNLGQTQVVCGCFGSVERVKEDPQH